MGDLPAGADVKWIAGWSVGGFIMYSDINHFGISGDVLYSQKGVRLENAPAAGAARAQYTTRINYLEIPVLARYFLTLSGSFRPNFFIGPSVAFTLNAKTKDHTVGSTEQPDRDVTNLYRPADLGLVGGVALNFEVAKGKRVLLDARYTYGLTDVTIGAGSIRNSAVTLNLSYGFGIGKKYSR
jgi:outer membrane protein W